MRVTDIILNTMQISGNNDGSAIITGIASGYEYVDGKRTDNLTHMKVEAIFPTNKYEKVSVKVKDLKLPITAEQLEQAGGQKKVNFKNLTGRFYWSNSGDYLLSANVDSMEVMTLMLWNWIKNLLLFPAMWFWKGYQKCKEENAVGKMIALFVFSLTGFVVITIVIVFLIGLLIGFLDFIPNYIFKPDK